MVVAVVVVDQIKDDGEKFRYVAYMAVRKSRRSFYSEYLNMRGFEAQMEG